MKIVFVEQDRCFGCKHCEWICAFQNVRDFRPEDSNIWVEVDQENRSIFNTTCFQCETARCLEACPTKSLKRDPRTDAVMVNQDTCIGCRSCVAACPFGNMRFDNNRRVAAKCDLCHGDPKCVKFCMAKALHYDDINELAGMKRKHANKADIG